MATNNPVNNIAPTQSPGTNNTTIATTAFVQAAISSGSAITTTKAVALSYLLGR